MKLTYFYKRDLKDEAEYQATSLMQLINNAQSWPATTTEHLAVLGKFVEHHALFSTLHTNKWHGFAETVRSVLGLYITLVVQIDATGTRTQSFTQFTPAQPKDNIQQKK